MAALQMWDASALLAGNRELSWGSRWRVRALEINRARDRARSARYCSCVSRVETWEEESGWSTGAGGMQNTWWRNRTKTAISLAS